jgi:hypothetical protein
MTVYEMPEASPYQKPFRAFASIAIGFMLVILCIALWTPLGLGDGIRHILAWTAGAIVIAGVAVGYRVAFKEGYWKLKRGYRVEVSDGKIIQKRAGAPIVEMPIDQIKSLQHRRGGWLVIRGGEPENEVAVPTDVIGFDSLKRELSANRQISPLPDAELSRWVFLPSASIVVAGLLLFLSHQRIVVMIAGLAILLIQGMAIFSIRRLLRSKPRLGMMYVAGFLVLAWIVFERLKTF